MNRRLAKMHGDGCPCNDCDRFEAAMEIAVQKAVAKVIGEPETAELLEAVYYRQHEDASRAEARLREMIRQRAEQIFIEMQKEPM
jgi:hypothetical protein